jgi:CO dehydrogenase nickel-insertion accessory protein CooC1
MKIAFVGKGGSGKSSITWLAVKTLESLSIPTLAIDADHNMDLTSNLGLDPEKTPLMHKTDKEFLEATGATGGKFAEYISGIDVSKLPAFSLFPHDAYTASVISNLSPELSLLNIGLGSPDIVFQEKCAHALSGPLKFYLGLLQEKDSFVVVDSVAGADMINFGLYAGIDAVIGVVEPHRNSIKVFEQIHEICRKTMIPCYAVVNKPTENDFYKDFTEKYSKKILGEIPFDTNIMNYAFKDLKKETINSMEQIIQKIKTIKQRQGLESILEFQKLKK